MNRFDNNETGRRYKNVTNYRPMIANYPSQFYFADLIDWGKKERIKNQVFVRENNGYQYILVVVDAYSRYCWMVNLKSKDHQSIIPAFESIFNKNVFNIASGFVQEITLEKNVQNIPKHIVTDQGTEFCNIEMNTYYEHNHIKHIILQGKSKAFLAERVIQDYKMFLRERFDKTHWTNWTNDFVNFYNHKKHSIIKDTPHNVFIEGHIPGIRNINYKKKDLNQQYDIGDQVRIRLNKNNLSKKSLHNNWSTEIYTIDSIDDKYKPIVYKIKDSEGNIVNKKFYHFELLKTK